MKALLVALAMAAGLAAAVPAAGASWGHSAWRLGAQAEKGQREAYERMNGPRDARGADRRERGERRESALTEEERRALHRDIDKANRELYRRRSR